MEDAEASADQRRRAWYAGCMSSGLIATVLTGVGVLAGVWAIVERKVEGVRRDLGAQIEGVRRRHWSREYAHRQHLARGPRARQVIDGPVRSP